MNYTSGSIRINGELIAADAPNIDQMRREIGMCFQHFNLFPHLSIIDNRKVADRVIFMAAGEIIKENDPETFFTSPQNARTRTFLDQVLSH